MARGPPGRPTEAIVALCDVDDEKIAAFLNSPEHAGERKTMYEKAAKYRDWRRMLDAEKGLDAITVSTPDHNHAIIAMAAMKKWLPHPFAPLLDPLGVAGGAEAPGPAGEHDQPLLGAVRAPDAGESAARVAAVEIAPDDFLDDRPEKAIFPLESALIFRNKPLEMMEQHPVENGAFRMPRPIGRLSKRLVEVKVVPKTR